MALVRWHAREACSPVELFSQVVVNGLTLGGMLALMAVGLTLIFGILRVVNLAHGELFMVGAYASFFFTHDVGLPYLLTIPISALMAAALATLLYFVVFRRFVGNLLGGAVASIALSVMLQSANALVFTGGQPKPVITPLTQVLEVGPVLISTQRFLVAVCGFAVMLALFLFMSRSRIGRAMRAVTQHQYGALVQGVNFTVVSAAAFALGGGLAGLAGGLMAPLSTLGPSMGLNPLLASFVIVILGGMGSIGGAALAALIIGLQQSAVGTYWSPELSGVVSFALAFAILVVRPTGLFGKAPA